MENTTQAMLDKANEHLSHHQKKMSVKPGSDGTYDIYVNGMLLYCWVTEENLPKMIMVAFFAAEVYQKTL